MNLKFERTINFKCYIDNSIFLFLVNNKKQAINTLFNKFGTHIHEVLLNAITIFNVENKITK